MCFIHNEPGQFMGKIEFLQQRSGALTAVQLFGGDIEHAWLVRGEKSFMDLADFFRALVPTEGDDVDLLGFQGTNLVDHER